MNNRKIFAKFASVVIAVVCFAAVLIVAIPGRSYVNEYVGTVPDHWVFSAFQVTYSINPSGGANITGGSAAAVNAIQDSFNTWNNAPNTSINIAYGGTSSATSNGVDGVNLICFSCAGDFSSDNSTLAVTWTTISANAGEDTMHGTRTSGAGEIYDADILFNPNVQWTTSGTPPSGSQDLQTVATHEIGHFFGLDHTGVARAVMYPFAAPLLTTLSYDDVAAISTLYPKATSDFPTGSISGTVSFVQGGAVFGGHVFADSTTNSPSVWPNIRKSTISALTKPDGTYVIKGVPPDKYAVGVEPLDLPVQNSDISDYSKEVGGRSSIDTTFNTRWH